MKKLKIIWADDEIELLKPHVLFLEEKGFEVHTTNSGNEAIDLINEQYFDIIFLDENMPGLSGMETLAQLKKQHPGVPVVMITKNENEAIMEEAIGSNIADYLIKPVNPNQILLCLKKNLEINELVSKKAISDYQQEFRSIGMTINERLNHDEWADVYKQIVRWELELEKLDDEGMNDILIMQKNEANTMFSRFIEANYVDWLKSSTTSKPLMSQTVFKEKVAPHISEKSSLFVLMVDNLRYDQWKAIQPLINRYYRTEKDEIAYSILPTATHYARNAFFAGLMPSEIEKKYPQYWKNEEDEGSKNLFESELLGEQLKRLNKPVKYSYNKIVNLEAGKKLVDNLHSLYENPLNVIVYNFIDMLSHARTDMEVLKELANDEQAYRSLTTSWFEHSPLMEIIKQLAEKNIRVIITADHGSVRVNHPVKVVGEKNTSKNLRYKIGRSLQYNKKEVFEVKNPNDVFLPSTGLSSTYIFAKSHDFFVYPNNYNYYVNFFENTFQHGGVSLEEVLVPLIFCNPNKPCPK